MADTIENRIMRKASRTGRIILAFLAMFMLVKSGAAFAADFEQGLKAFRSGNVQQALEAWQPLAQSGHAEAQHGIGMMHEYGRGLQRSDALAAQWYRKAADQGMPEAQYRLGVFRENGWGVPVNAALAVQWYERAANAGHVLAQHDLAFMYLDGQGVRKDGVQAYKWLKIASVQRPDLMTKHLLNVSKTLTADELIRAEILARAWLNAQEI